MKNFKKLLVENELGSASAQPHATIEKSADLLTIKFSNKELYPADQHQQAEEVKEVLVEGRKPMKFKKKKPAAAKTPSGLPQLGMPTKNRPLKEEVEGPSEEAKEEMASSGMAYKDKFEALLKEFGVEKISELSDEEKIEFFNTLDDIHVSKEESGEGDDVKISDDSASLEFKGELNTDMTPAKQEALEEALRIIYNVLKEEETVEVPVDAEAEVKVEEDKIVVEIPLESPKEVISQPEAEVLAEAFNAIKLILRK
jgi:hypothetical protein